MQVEEVVSREHSGWVAVVSHVADQPKERIDSEGLGPWQSR
jgi:hypothetical protein